MLQSLCMCKVLGFGDFKDKLLYLAFGQLKLRTNKLVTAYHVEKYDKR